MDTNSILASLRAERGRLDKAISAIEGLDEIFAVFEVKKESSDDNSSRRDLQEQAISCAREPRSRLSNQGPHSAQ